MRDWDMLRINYMSDLHLEFERPLILNENALVLDNLMDADVLVLAGDVNIEKQTSWIEDVAEKYKDIIYIMGNHEYYRGKYPETMTLIKDVFHNSNVHVLENDSVTIDDVTFHGCTLWTNCSNYNPIAVSHVDGALNDFRLIRTNNGADRFTAKYSTEVHYESFKWLKSVVKPGDVVVTHHAPSYQSVHPRFAGDPLNAAFVSSLDEDVMMMDPQVWFHGHVHTSFDYKIGDARVLCNPRGYVGYEENSEFSMDAVYETIS